MTKPRTGVGVRVAVSGKGSLALPAEEILGGGDLGGMRRGGIGTSRGLGWQWHQRHLSLNASLPAEIQPCE